MDADRISFERSTNARPYHRVARHHPHIAPPKRDVARFGGRMANSLLLLELGAARKIQSGWDADWFEGEFLSRLRDAFFSQPDVTEGQRVNFDWNAWMYEYESLDILLLDVLSRSGYRDMLLAVLRSIYEEEQIGGAITAAVRHAFRLPRF